MATPPTNSQVNQSYEQSINNKINPDIDLEDPKHLRSHSQAME